jgi:sporulation protein YlmC with PRC-barrel domain
VRRPLAADFEDSIMSNRRFLSCKTLAGNKVRNGRNEDLGKVEDFMLDIKEGKIAYAVLSFGGFIGFGEKLFAVPWSALRLDQDKRDFVLDVEKDALKSAPGFEKDKWPDFADPTFGRQIHEHYKTTPYWDVPVMKP